MENQTKSHVSTRAEILQVINKERDRQIDKWGIENHQPQFWTGLLGEEFGEYCQAVNETVLIGDGAINPEKGGYENMLTELSHVAATAINAMECLMRNKEKLT